MKVITTLISLLFFSPAIFAQSYIPDAGFGNNGVAITPQTDKSGIIYSTAIQSNGRIVSAGESYDDSLNRHSFLARYMPDGTLDAGFGTQGKINIKVGWNDAISSVLVQTDGKITAAGNETIKTVIPGNPPQMVLTTRPFLIRYKPDGTLDSAFGTNGIHRLSILGSYADKQIVSIVQLPDGRLVAGGSLLSTVPMEMALVCLRPDGTYDTGFGTNGMAWYTIEPGENATLFALCAQPDGKIILGGSSGAASLAAPPNTKMGFVRVLPDGTPDASFGAGGLAAIRVAQGIPYPYDVVSKIALRPGGKIVAAGGSSGKLALVQLNANGSLDATFGQGGIAKDTGRLQADGLCILANGNVLTSTLKSGSNNTSDIILSRFTTAGIPDASFGTAGSMTINQSAKERSYAMNVQPDQKVIISGHSVDPVSGKTSFTLWRLADPNAPTGISSVSTHLYQAALYPNPAEADVMLSLKQLPTAPLYMQLLDMQGRTLFTEQVRSAHTRIPLSGLATGIYVFRLSSVSGTEYITISKK